MIGKETDDIKELDLNFDDLKIVDSIIGRFIQSKTKANRTSNTSTIIQPPKIEDPAVIYSYPKIQATTVYNKSSGLPATTIIKTNTSLSSWPTLNPKEVLPVVKPTNSTINDNTTKDVPENIEVFGLQVWVKGVIIGVCIFVILILVFLMIYYKKCRDRVRYLLSLAWYKEANMGKKLEDFGVRLKKTNQI